MGKNEIYRTESNKAALLAEEHRHPEFGFNCLNFAVSESSGFIKIKVHNKQRTHSSVGVRTVELTDGAKDQKDFIAVDEVINFKGDEWGEVQIKIIDDEQWEPDKEFAVELYDPNTKSALPLKDTRCVVLILDDDKPGFLSFGEGKRTNVKHVATEEKCTIKVYRSKGSDGRISCRFRTVQLANQVGRMAEPGKDYMPKEGVLHFEHQESEKEIVVDIV